MNTKIMNRIGNNHYNGTDYTRFNYCLRHIPKLKFPKSILRCKECGYPVRSKARFATPENKALMREVLKVNGF